MTSTISRRTLAVLVAALALLGSAAAVAIAATVVGTDSGETLNGTQLPDRVFARGGDDTVNALAGPDRVFAGDGDDTVNAGRGNDRVHGGDGNDEVRGVQGNDLILGGRGNDTLEGDTPNTGDRTSYDRISGGPGTDTITGGDSYDKLSGGDDADIINGNGGRDVMSGGSGDDKQYGGERGDRIFANLGNDETFGGDGNDDLWALARGDVTAPNGQDTAGDVLHGEGGDDVFHVRDGEQDVVDCGAGADTVLADRFDVVTSDCETVRRADPRPREDRREREGR
jgi:Ca2+-binding RTX toxin-like protein